MKHVLGTSPALAERTSIAKSISYDLLIPVRTLRRELGLGPNDISVLAALISFLPRERTERKTETTLFMTIVFPSNEALSERANGLDERTIRRCVVRLVNAGLVLRKASANGKRFPLRFGGAIQDAFGFDLAPLAQQHAALTERAREATETHQDLRSLRAKALALRAAAMQNPTLNDDQLAKVVAARNLLRRATLKIDEIESLIATLQNLVQSDDNNSNAQTNLDKVNAPGEIITKTRCVTARNGQNVRHIESNKKEFKRLDCKTPAKTSHANKLLPSMNSDPTLMAWEEFTHVASFYPDPPATADSLTRTLLEIGKLFRISQDRLFRALKTSGPGRMLLAFNYLLARAEDIRDPSSYLEKMMGVHASAKMS